MTNYVCYFARVRQSHIEYVRFVRCYQFTYDLNTISNDQTLPKLIIQMMLHVKIW